MAQTGSYNAHTLTSHGPSGKCSQATGGVSTASMCHNADPPSRTRHTLSFDVAE